MYLPVIDLSKLDLSSFETDEWASIRNLVMEAIENYGSFEVKFDKLTPELRDAVFGKAMKELFSRMNTSNTNSIVGTVNTPDQKSINLIDATKKEEVDEFAAIMWGDGGNLSFSDTIYAYAKHLEEIVQIVQRMVLEGLGIEKYADELKGASVCTLRLSEYGAQKNTEKTPGISVYKHVDTSFLSLVCQHGIGELQCQTKDGSWLIPSPYSMTVLVGDLFWAWTNGRIKPSWHQVVRTDADVKRCSVVCFSNPAGDYLIKTPEELIDEKHPKQFNPFKQGDYLRFVFSEGAYKNDDALKTFCGVKREKNDEECVISF